MAWLWRVCAWLCQHGCVVRAWVVGHGGMFAFAFDTAQRKAAAASSAHRAAKVSTNRRSSSTTSASSSSGRGPAAAATAKPPTRSRSSPRNAAPQDGADSTASALTTTPKGGVRETPSARADRLAAALRTAEDMIQRLQVENNALRQRLGIPLSEEGSKLPRGGSTRGLGLRSRRTSSDHGEQAPATAMVSSRGWSVDGTDLNDFRMRMAFLKSVPLFHSLAEDQLEKLATKMDARVFAPGSVIVQQGDEGSEFFVIVEGHVRVCMPVPPPPPPPPPPPQGRCVAWQHRGWWPRRGVVRFGVVLCWCISKCAVVPLHVTHARRVFSLCGRWTGLNWFVDDIMLCGVVLLCVVCRCVCQVAVHKRSYGEPQDSRGALVAKLTAGDFFGERALIKSDLRAASCLATTAVTCLSLSKETFVQVSVSWDVRCVSRLAPWLDTNTRAGPFAQHAWRV